MFFFSLWNICQWIYPFNHFTKSSIPGTFFIYNINNAQGKKKISDCSFVNYFLTPPFPFSKPYSLNKYLGQGKNNRGWGLIYFKTINMYFVDPAHKITIYASITLFLTNFGAYLQLKLWPHGVNKARKMMSQCMFTYDGCTRLHWGTDRI